MRHLSQYGSTNVLVKLSTTLPLYESLKRELQERIENGELPEGTRILPEIELARTVGVSRSTARKALQALEMEGYLSRTAGRGSFVKARRKAAAKTAATARGTLGVTLCGPDRFNHAGEVLQGFLNRATSGGYRALVHPQVSGGTDQFEYLVDMRGSGIDAWALWLTKVTEKTTGLLRHIQDSGCALVLVDRFVRHLDTDYVVTKNEEMAYDLTLELIRRGHREVGFINFRDENTVNEEREAGYTRALADGGAPLNADFMVRDELDDLDALRMELLAMLGLRRRPTAVFCASARHARVLVEELQRLGYAIPEDIELAVVDDDRMAELAGFPILSARQRSYDMGCIAAELLWARLECPDREWHKVRLDYDLNFRRD